MLLRQDFGTGIVPLQGDGEHTHPSHTSHPPLGVRDIALVVLAAALSVFSYSSA